jgi:hypothetical protein
MGISKYFQRHQYAGIADTKRHEASQSIQSSTFSIAHNNSVFNGGKSLFSGWRFGVLLSCIASFLLLTINATIVIYASHRFPVDKHTGLGTIFEGSCKKTKRMDTVLHIGINIISTGLLAASNYTSQIIVSPNRKDIDKSHAAGRYLDIGVQSIRNLRFLPVRRKILWVLLIASSVPLHLL